MNLCYGIQRYEDRMPLLGYRMAREIVFSCGCRRHPLSPSVENICFFSI